MGAAKRPQLDSLLTRFEHVKDADETEWGGVADQLKDFVGQALLTTIGEAARSDSITI
jgi:hypothetical protein